MPESSRSDLKYEIVGKSSSQGHDQKPRLDRLFGAGLALIVVFSAFLYIELSACWPQFGRAEVFFAECAREMIEAGNWVTPLYHGQGFFDKPILTYWLIIGCFGLFGADHFIARIPSIIASLTTIIVTALACRRAFGQSAALISAAALASSFMFIHFSALCMSDSWLVLCDTATLVAMYAGAKVSERRSIYWFFAAVFLSLGFLVKGPVAMVLPLGFFACYLIATKNSSSVRIKHLLIGTLTVIAIAAPWFLMAFQQCGLEAMVYFFVRENVQRFAGNTYDTHRPVWFMLVSLLSGFAPWSIFLPPALACSIHRWRSVRTDQANGSSNAERANLELFLWLWIATVVGFFSVSRGKIDYYALPAYPACAALVGLYLNDWIRGVGASKVDSFGRNVATVAAYLLSIILVIAGIACASLLSELRETSIWSLIWLAVPLLLVGLSTLIACRRRMMFSAYATIFSGIVLAGTIYALVIMPAIVALYPVLSYSKTIANASPPVRAATSGTTTPVALSISASLPGESSCATTPAVHRETMTGNVGIFGELDTWVNEVTFNTQREPKVLKTGKQLATYVNSAGGNWLIIWEKDYLQLPAELQRKLKVVDSQKMIQKKIVIGAFSNKARIENATKLVLAVTR